MRIATSRIPRPRGARVPGQRVAGAPRKVWVRRGDQRLADHVLRPRWRRAGVAGLLATHCLRPVESQDEGTVGLGFEPKPGRTLVDIEGVLWIDTVEIGPRELEFQYTSLRPFLRRHLEPALRAHFMSRDPRTRFHPIEIDEAEFGGVLRFERITRGRWLIREWSIRRPVLTQKYLWRVNHGTTVWPRAYPLTTSGEVLALHRPSDIDWFEDSRTASQPRCRVPTKECRPRARFGAGVEGGTVP